MSGVGEEGQRVTEFRPISNHLRVIAQVYSLPISFNQPISPHLLGPSASTALRIMSDGLRSTGTCTWRSRPGASKILTAMKTAFALKILTILKILTTLEAPTVHDKLERWQRFHAQICPVRQLQLLLPHRLDPLSHQVTKEPDQWAWTPLKALRPQPAHPLANLLLNVLPLFPHRLDKLLDARLHLVVSRQQGEYLGDEVA